MPAPPFSKLIKQEITKVISVEPGSGLAKDKLYCVCYTATYANGEVGQGMRSIRAQDELDAWKQFHIAYGVANNVREEDNP